MEDGYFFVHETYKGISSYRYTTVKSIRPPLKFEYPEHPLSVVLSEERVEFKFHGKVKEEEPTQSFELFHLNLNQEADAQSYSKWVIEDLCYEDINLYHHYRWENHDKLSFRKIEELNFGSSEDFACSIFKINSPNPTTDFKQCHFFLDFLFDFFHSDIFVSHPNYQDIKEKLLQNVIISGIYDKCEYYYWIAKHNELVNQNQDLQNFQQKGHYKEALIQLAEAESKWIEKIIDPQYLSLFSIDIPWFFDSETELKHATHQDIKTPSGLDWKGYITKIVQADQGKKNIFSRFRIEHQKLKIGITTFWVRRYNIFESVHYNFSIKKRDLIIFSIFSFILTAILWCTAEKTLTIEYFLFHVIGVLLYCGVLGAILTIAPIVLFVLQLFKNTDFNRSLISTFLPRMQLGIISGWLIFATSGDLWKINYDITLFSVGILSIPLFLLSLYYINNEVQREAPDLPPKYIFARSFFILITGFTISMCIGLFLMSFEGQKMIQRIPEIKQKYKLGEINKFKKSEYQFEDQLDKYNRLHQLTIGYLDDHSSDKVDQQYVDLISDAFATTTHFSDIASIPSDRLRAFRNRFQKLDSTQQQIKGLKSHLIPSAEKAWKEKEQELILDIQQELFTAITITDDSLSKVDSNLIELHAHMENEEKCFDNFVSKGSTEICNRNSIHKPYYVFRVTLSFPLRLPFIIWFSFSFIIYPILLFFNAVLALFVGLFVQLLLQQKNITDPI